MRIETYLPDGTLIDVQHVDTPEDGIEAARQSALAKLQALGLTEQEALALVGGTP
jgi:hypothetical protein